MVSEVVVWEHYTVFWISVCENRMPRSVSNIDRVMVRSYEEAWEKIQEYAKQFDYDLVYLICVIKGTTEVWRDG